MAKERDEARAEQIAADAIVRAETMFVDVSMKEFAELMGIIAEQINERHQAAREEAGL